MRLIDADALIEQIEQNICKPCKERKDDYNGVRCRACQYGDEMDDIEDAPTIEERKKGRWIIRYAPHNSYYANMMSCSVCGHEEVEDDYNFCPNCGADKRGNDGKTESN